MGWIRRILSFFRKFKDDSFLASVFSPQLERFNQLLSEFDEIRWSPFFVIPRTKWANKLELLLKLRLSMSRTVLAIDELIKICDIECETNSLKNLPNLLIIFSHILKKQLIMLEDLIQDMEKECKEVLLTYYAKNSFMYDYCTRLSRKFAKLNCYGNSLCEGLEELALKGKGVLKEKLAANK